MLLLGKLLAVHAEQSRRLVLVPRSRCALHIGLLLRLCRLAFVRLNGDGQPQTQHLGVAQEDLVRRKEKDEVDAVTNFRFGEVQAVGAETLLEHVALGLAIGFDLWVRVFLPDQHEIDGTIDGGSFWRARDLNVI